MAAAAPLGGRLKKYAFGLAAFALAAVIPASAADHFVILGGLGGEPAFAERFSEQTVELGQLCGKIAAQESLVHVLDGNDATQQNVKTLMDRLRLEMKPDDVLVLFLIGHGSYDGVDYKFNIPGRDISAAQLQQWLNAIPAKDQLVVNMTSASGASIDWLKSDRRAVITATRSGRERTITVFPEFWLEGLTEPAADTDKNDVVTALEAFRYAEARVKEFYEKEKRLATEHARLEGDTAASFTLARFGSAQQAAADPATRELLTQRTELERQIAALQRRKDEMEAKEYTAQLEKLLLELARIQAKIDAAVGEEPKELPPPSPRAEPPRN
jgi:hypothetical protein